MDALLIVIFGLLHVADGVITYLGLSFFDVAEANPVLNYCADVIGLGCAIPLLKAGGMAFIIFMFFDRRRSKSRWITATLASSVIFYSYVVTQNVLLVVA